MYKAKTTKEHKYKHISNLVVRPEDNRSVIMKIADLPAEQRIEILEKIAQASYPELGLKGIKYDWSINGRQDQLIPLDLENDWNVFVYNMGRGGGKTRSCAEWVRHIANKYPGTRIALVGATTSDIHKTILGGDSGLLNISPPWEKVHHIPTYNRIVWENNGSIAEYFSAEKPDRLRGPQFHHAWLDEITSWNNVEATFDMLSFGLRLGNDNRIVVSTTPKNLEFYKKLLNMSKTWTLVGSTFDNAANLSTKFIKDMVDRYEGTRLGTQELNADVLDDIEGALWRQSWIDKNRVRVDRLGTPEEELPEFLYVALAIDPAMTTNKNSDETGMCVAAYGVDDKYYILYADSEKLTPHEWAKRAMLLYDKYFVTTIVAETNQGGDMVKENLTKLRPDIVVHGIHAKKGKALRAEEVVHMYELNKVRHVGFLPRAESQMTEFNPITNPSGKDDICLIGETLIETIDGKIQIKSIKKGDLVLTRNGYKKVLESSITGVDSLVYAMLLSNGNILVGTGNHPIFIHNKDFTAIKNIEVGDLVYKCQKEKLMLTQSSLTELFIEDTQIQKAQVLEDTTIPMEDVLSRDLEDCIEKFGNLFTEKFQTDMLFTIRIETVLTTTFQILNAFQKSNIWKNIETKSESAQHSQNILNTLTAFDTWLQSGINLLKEENGTEDTQKKTTLERLKILNVFVSSAVQNLILSETQLCSVLENVAKNSTETPVSMLLQNNAQFATLLSWIIIHMEKEPKSVVQESVLGKLELRRDKVYNLKVEDESEYFANGILTHNCDALVYSVKALMEKAMVSSVYNPAVGGLRHKLMNFRAR